MALPVHLVGEDPFDIPAALAGSELYTPQPTPVNAPTPAPAAKPATPATQDLSKIPIPAAPDTSRSQERYQAELGEIKRRQKALDTAELGRVDKEKEQITAAYKAAAAADDKLLADLAAGRHTTQEEVKKLPEWKPEPVVKSQDFQNFSTMLMGLAMILGTSFKGGWIAASGSLNGAMEGYLDGNLEKAEQHYKDFQRQYAVQMDKVKAAQKDMEDVLYADDLTIKEKDREINLLSALIGRDDMRAAHQQQSIDKMFTLANSSANAITAADTRYKAIEGSMNVAMARLKAAYGATDLMTDNAKKALAKLGEITGGKNDLFRMASSRYTRTHAIPLINELVEGVLQKNPGMKGEEVGQELAQNASKYTAQTATLRQTMQREAGVARLTLAVQGLEQNVIQAAQQYGLFDQRWMNSPMNMLRDKMGDADYTRFHNLVVAVARQYIEAITMPGSNAQLHASSQEVADRMISDDMTLSQLMGAFDAFNMEITATGSALENTVNSLFDSIGAPGVKSLISYSGPMFSGPMTYEQTQKRWNELPTEFTR